MTLATICILIALVGTIGAVTCALIAIWKSNQ
jgi:hypothetical protein